jgi:hypothetical protein
LRFGAPQLADLTAVDALNVESWWISPNIARSANMQVARPVRRGGASADAAIVRDRRHIADRGDLKPDSLQARAEPTHGPNRDRRLRLRASSCRVPSLLAGVFSGDLRGIRRRLARALEPIVPADDQEIALPCTSVMVIMVLLNDEFTCATPE